MKNERTWFAADVSIPPEAVEAVEYALAQAGASGTEYSTLGVKEIRPIVLVIGYFDDEPNVEIIESEIENALKIYDLPPGSVVEISVRSVENKDWLAEWKKSWRPTETGKFIVAPAWSDVGETSKTIIRIEPSMAFGTGTHETTRLCLKAIEELYEPEMSLFDVGTGTGILAVAAAKIQGESKKPRGKIVGCDTDEDSIKIAAENAALNAVEEIEFYVGSISADMPRFDFVCANLTADVILPLLPPLIEKSERILLLSGILKEQERLVIGELNSKFKIHSPQFKIQTDGEWISVIVDRSSNG